MDKGHITTAIEFSDLVRSTLGPRGMNKMIMGEHSILTNDGATIVGSMKGGHPIVELFKNLAKSQEEAIGDGTTTAIILAGQLLNNALTLINKGIHPTTIITGYEVAKSQSLQFISQSKLDEPVEKIIRTSFGTKLSRDIVNHLTNLLLQIKDYENLQLIQVNNSDPLESELFKGHVFPGFTINDRMKSEVTGKIAVLDFAVNFKMDNFSVTNADEMVKVQNLDSKFKQEIVDRLCELGVKWVFYTDTTPEFETYLTQKGISGVVVYARENIDGICRAVKAISCSAVDQIKEEYMGNGHIKYVKGKQGLIYVDGEVETLILKGNTSQLLDEEKRAFDDVIGLLRHDLKCVLGAGCFEIQLGLNLREFANRIGGKEQLAIEKFAESIESIPQIIAENAGLDAIEIVTNLKAMHKAGKNTMGVDVLNEISDANERGIFEPALIKHHAISSATNIANLILKLDGIYEGNK